MACRLLLVSMSIFSLLAAFAVGMPAGAQAATLTVTNLNDSGPGSLRQAIASAASGDTITFAVRGTITLTSGQLTLDKDLTIAGPGAAVLAISGNGVSGVFLVEAGVTAVIDGLTLRDGVAAGSDYGDAIRNLGTLTLTRSTVTANPGGTAIYNRYQGGVMTISDSTITQNAGYGVISEGTLMTIERSTIAGSAYDGVRNYGASMEIIDSRITGNGDRGILALGEVTITRSTIAGNGEEGVFSQGAPLVTITSSTISANGWGIVGRSSSGLSVRSSTIAFNRREGLITIGPVTLTNSIVAHNAGGNCAATMDPLTSGGFNLSSDATCFTAGGTDRLSTDPLLGPLADNGGPTPTHLPLPGSPAINGGGPAPCPTDTDQRGISRPQRSACDIGAVEVAWPVITALAPSRMPLSSTPQTLTIRGRNFAEGATVTVGRQTYTATFISSTELRISVLPKDVFVYGWLVVPTAKVTVVNPGGATSNSVTLYLRT
jgi:hypothetical protein